MVLISLRNVYIRRDDDLFSIPNLFHDTNLGDKFGYNSVRIKVVYSLPSYRVKTPKTILTIEIHSYSLRKIFSILKVGRFLDTFHDLLAASFANLIGVKLFFLTGLQLGIKHYKN